jgi:hypothetical protein
MATPMITRRGGYPVRYAKPVASARLAARAQQPAITSRSSIASLGIPDIAAVTEFDSPRRREARYGTIRTSAILSRATDKIGLSGFPLVAPHSPERLGAFIVSGRLHLQLEFNYA